MYLFVSNTAVQKCGFCEGKMFRKKQKKVSCQICNIWFHKKYTQLSEKDFKSISFTKKKKKKNLSVSLVFVNMFRLDLQRTIKI